MKVQGSIFSRCMRPRLALAAVALLTLSTVWFRGLAAPTDDAGNATPHEQTDRASRIKPIKGRVLDDAGRPLAGATVILRPAGADPDSANQGQTVRTDEDGAFSFDAIAVRPYTVAVFGFEDPAAGQYHLPGENIILRVENGGVITGRVTSIDGEPLVGVRVTAKCIRGKGDKPLTGSSFSDELSRSRLTDDRGIYRFWGLQPGVYTVSAGRPDAGLVSAYDDDSPTYYPSSTLGSATRIVVSSGQELTGIDIRYRGYRGHAVSGTIAAFGPQSYVVYLATGGGDYLDSAWVQAGQSAEPFEFARVSDGDYVLIAVSTNGKEILSLSRPVPVTVKGADITGINLRTLPFGSLTGRIRLENDPNLDCKNRTNSTLVETVLSLRKDAGATANNPPLIESQMTYAASPDGNGQFAMKRVPAGDYRIEAWLPNEDWYISAMALGSGAQQTDVALKGISVSQGQAISSLSVVMKNGAAGLSGRIVSATAGTALSTGLRVYLLPAEPSRAGERLRFFETEAGSDGSFKLKNLAPGRYRIAARPVRERESTQPAADTVAGRTRLLREAGGKALVIELHPCEKQTDYVLKYGLVPQSG